MLAQQHHLCRFHRWRAQFSPAAAAGPVGRHATLSDGARGGENVPTGYFNPTNVVALDGLLYSMFLAEPVGAQRAGVCVMRTADIADPGAWRAWSGSAFDVRFINPYQAAVAEPARHVCAPVGSLPGAFPVHSLVRHRPSGQFLLVMTNLQASTVARPQGVYLMRSADLVRWSPLELLLAVPTTERTG